VSQQHDFNIQVKDHEEDFLNKRIYNLETELSQKLNIIKERDINHQLLLEKLERMEKRIEQMDEKK
jgi:hypothetical protein